MLVAQTDPSARGCPLKPIFMPCGAPKAHDVFHEKADPCQEFFLLCLWFLHLSVQPSRPVATLPSTLFDERFFARCQLGVLDSLGAAT